MQINKLVCGDRKCGFSCVCFQVQVRHFVCHGRACICGVAVREGDTVLGLDACESRLNRTPYALKVRQYSATRATGAAVYRDSTGRNFAVSFIVSRMLGHLQDLHTLAFSHWPLLRWTLSKVFPNSVSNRLWGFCDYVPNRLQDYPGSQWEPR